MAGENPACREIIHVLEMRDDGNLATRAVERTAEASRLLPLGDEYPGVGQDLSVLRHECRLRETTLERAHSFQGHNLSA